MLKKILLFCLLLSQILPTACTSGKRAFESGNYERATYLAIDRLRRSPDHKKSRQTLDKAYHLFIKKNQADVNAWQASLEPLKWDNVVDVYQRTHQVFDQIKACPAALEVVRNPLRFDNELQEARRKASEGHYEVGLNELAGGTREKARSAYQHFKKAQEYYPNLKSDYTARLNEAKQKATLQVAVWLAPTSANFNLQKFGVTDALMRNDLNQFVQDLDKRFFLDAELVLDPNQQNFDDLLKIACTQFNPEQTQYAETNEQRTDSIRIETSVNGQTFVSYERVWADINVREKSFRTTGALEILITDAETGQILFNQAVQGEYIWRNKWAILRAGDARAANAQQKELLNRREEPTPSYQNLFDELQKIMAVQLKQKLTDYYKEY